MPNDMVVTDAPARLRFAGLLLDPARGALFGRDGAEIVLRPKTFALLRLLAENPGRLVERDAIMDAVWPDVTVTDDSITQCVGDIRRAFAVALGEEGPRLLRTMPRRGYMLDTAVEEVGREVVPVPVTEAVPEVPPAVTSRAVAASPRVPVRWQPVAWATLGAAVAAAVVLAFVAGGGLPGATGDGASAGAVSGTSRPPAPRDEAQRLLAEGRALINGRGNQVENWLAARVLFERAILLDPGLQAAYAEAVYTYTNVVLRDASLNPQADLRAAERLAERAVALGAGTASAQNARAAVLRHQGRYAEAMEAYRQVTALEPSWGPPRANAAWMLVLLGRPEEAVGPLRRVLASMPDFVTAPTWRAYLGVAQLYAGVEDHGVAMLQSIAQWRTDIAPEAIQMHLAAALAAQGSTSDARAALDGVRQRRPEVGPDWLSQNFPAPSAALSARGQELGRVLSAAWSQAPTN